jgi:hypothetical protein
MGEGHWLKDIQETANEARFEKSEGDRTARGNRGRSVCFVREWRICSNWWAHNGHTVEGNRTIASHHSH